MSNRWQYQLRIDLGDEFSDLARRDPDNQAIRPLGDILSRHHATLKCQFDAFADYVAEAEKRGTEKYPLYEWTKATIEDPAKKENTSSPLRCMSMAMKSTLKRRRTRSNQSCSHS